MEEKEKEEEEEEEEKEEDGEKEEEKATSEGWMNGSYKRVLMVEREESIRRIGKGVD